MYAANRPIVGALCVMILSVIAIICWKVHCGQAVQDRPMLIEFWAVSGLWIFNFYWLSYGFVLVSSRSRGLVPKGTRTIEMKLKWKRFFDAKSAMWRLDICITIAKFVGWRVSFLLHLSFTSIVRWLLYSSLRLEEWCICVGVED